MFSYYFRMAVRALARHRFHAAVSFVSLSLGFVCFIAATVIAGHLSSWDRQFPDSDRMFTVATSGPNPRTDGVPLAPRHLPDYLESEFPEIESATALTGGVDYNVSTRDVTDSMSVLFAEGDYLEVFPLPLLPPADGLDELPPDRVLITERAALARFGTTDVVGERIIVAHRLELAIAGVVERTAGPNHLKSALSSVELVASARVLDQLDGAAARGADAENWHDQSSRVFVKLAAGAPLDVRGYNERLRAFSERRVPVRYYLSGPHQPVFSFIPIERSGPAQLKLVFGDFDPTVLLIVAGFVVLVVASLNYSNLVIAQLTRRSQEIAVQKVLGAKRRQLMAQYSLESFGLAGLALLTAAAVCGIVLAGADMLQERGFHAALLLDADLWLTCAAGLMLITLIAGTYPALRVTRRSLSSMLRPAGGGSYSHRLRSLMVGTQFAVSSALLILAIFIFNQNRTMVLEAREAVSDTLVVLEGIVPESDSELDRLEAELRRGAGVQAVTRTANVPWALGDTETTALSLAPDPIAGRPFALNRVTVGFDYFKTMQMPLLAGRVFSEEFANDVFPPPYALVGAPGPYSIVVDAGTAARLGWPEPSQAVGKTVYSAHTPPSQEPFYVELTIVGVVGNQPLEIAALGYNPTHVFVLSPDRAGNLIVRTSAGGVSGALDYIDEVWRRFYPDAPARPAFLDEVFNRNYSIISMIGNVISAFAVFAFAIAVVGLVGMATFITGLRRREVGIRKVLGASRARITRMLLTRFAKPVLIANLVAWPVGFVLASAYLSIFYIRTPVTLVPFVLSLALTVGVAVLAVGWQVRSGARLRPATVLKQE